MAMGDDELKVPLGFDVNTANAEQGMQRISTLASQIREDFRLINEAVEGVTDKADRMREYFQGNVDIISGMKSLLEAIQSINQANQTTIGNNITLISELLNSVKGLNGDITHAMQLVNQAAGAMQGVGGGVNIGNTSTNSQNFSGLVQNERRVEPTSPIGYDEREKEGVTGTTAVNPVSSVVKTNVVNPTNPIQQQIVQQQQHQQPPGPTPPGPGPILPPIPPRPPRPPIRGPGSPPPGDDDNNQPLWKFWKRTRPRVATQQPVGAQNNSQVTGEDQQYYGEPRGVKQSVDQIELRDYLRANADMLYERAQGTNAIPVGGEHKAAEYAYANMLRQMKTVANVLPGNLGRQIMAHAQGALYNYGSLDPRIGGPIDMESIKRAQKDNTDYLKDANGNIQYRTFVDSSGVEQKMPLMQRTSGSYTPVEQAAIQIANTVSKVMSSPAGQYGTMAVSAYGLGKSLYGGAQSITDYIGQYAQNAQAQAQAFGTVSYTRSANNYMQALEESGFGLNPLISTAQVQQMQMQGAALGLRGSALSNFVEQAKNNQIEYGMSSAASQNLENTALGAGISTNDIMNANAQVRQIEANSQTSTTYGSLALATGAMGSATMGAGSAAAATMGVQAVNFGKGDLIAQSYGMTGQEGTGTQLNNVLMSQALGTSYLGLFAAERKAKGSDLARAQNKSDEQILGWAGIDTTSAYKNKDDFLNKNQNQIMVLSTLLSDPSMGSKLNNIGSSPQASADWAWNVVKQHQNFSKSDAANKAEQQQGFFRHLWGDVSHPILSGIDKAIGAGKAAATDIGHAVRDTVDAPGSVIGNIVHGANYGIEFAKATTDAITQGHDINIGSVGKAADADNRSYDNSLGRYLQPLSTQNTNWIATNTHKAWNNAYETMTTSQDGPMQGFRGQNTPQQIEVNIHPNAKSLITAAVKNGTNGFNSGAVPPNKQPTR